MTGKIFINFRREDSIGTAGRLYDRLEQAFGRKNIFMDVVGADLNARLNNQVAVCQAFVAVISPNCLGAKDDAGQRLLLRPDDFIALEIAAALARKIRVVPVLVNGAHMPRASELPESLKPLARCQAVEVDQNYFDEDVETLIETVREALNGGLVRQSSRRMPALAWVATVAGLLVVGWTGLHWMDMSVWPPWSEATEAANAKLQPEARAKRKSDEAGQQRLATLSVAGDAEAEAKRKSEEAEQQRLAAEAEARRKSEEAEQQRLAALHAAEAEAKRKSEEAEQQRVAALRVDEEHNRAEVEARTRYSALVSQGAADFKAGDYDRAIANYNEAIQLDPKSANVFSGRR